MVTTVSYMPPEQALGGEVTPKSDLYSLGAMLYEMVTGRPPFLGDDSVAIIGQHINTPPVAPTWHNGECPRALDALILRLLAKDPAERPESATDVLSALVAVELISANVGPGVDSAPEGDNVALDSLAGGVFVGRQQEMGDLKAALEDALSGRGRLVTLVGEPGIGKTRTAQELATYAGLRGANVLWGRCYEGQGAPSYWPWVQALRSYVRDRDPQELRSEMGSGAAAGFYEITGWPDLPPDGPWAAYTDGVAPRILSSTIMAALDHRRRTGQGQFIDAGQMEMALQFLAPQLIDFDVNGRTVTRNGNRSELAAPHGAYPCAGDDQWCAIAVESEEQWQSFKKVLGGPEWAGDTRFDSLEGRLQNQDELDQNISVWTANLPPKEVMRRMQLEGVPSGMVQRSSDLMQDPQIIHRRLFRELDHPETGVMPYTGHLFNIQGYDSGPRFAAPVLGQHNEQVLKEILGMSDEEVIEAVIAGALE